MTNQRFITLTNKRNNQPVSIAVDGIIAVGVDDEDGSDTEIVTSDHRYYYVTESLETVQALLGIAPKATTEPGLALRNQLKAVIKHSPEKTIVVVLRDGTTAHINDFNTASDYPFVGDIPGVSVLESWDLSGNYLTASGYHDWDIVAVLGVADAIR
jgi:hypothetical protein